MIEIKIKAFSELTNIELYHTLQLRSAIFVVEQDCVYQDLDGNDKKAFHVLGYKNEKIVAYTRIFRPGDYFELASIGRVVVAENERKHKYGFNIMDASAEAIKALFNETTIKISAQVYLKRFYNNLGYIEVGDMYLEDNIPHIAMIKK